MLILKIYFLIYILYLVQEKVQGDIVCIERCKTCDFTACLECDDGFYYNPQLNKCISECNYGQYYQTEAQQCFSICPYQYYNDNTDGSCNQLPQCPSLVDQGNQYFNEFTNYLQIRDYIYVSGISQQSSATSSDYSLKIFEDKECQILGSMSGHTSQIISFLYIPSNSASNLQESLVSLSANEIIQWDLKYGQIMKRSVLNTDYYIPSSSEQMILFDENNVIINRNETYFGILDYRGFSSDNSAVNFNKYVTMFDVVHLNTIIGYFQTTGSVMYSYSQVDLVKWKLVDYSHTMVCTFDDNVNLIIKVSATVQIILFSQTSNIQTLYRDQCSDLDVGSTDMVLQIDVVDSLNQIIVTLSLNTLQLLQVQAYDSNSSEMYSSQLSSIALANKVAFMNVYDQSELDSNKQIVTKRNLILVYVNGLLRIYEIAQYTEDVEIPSNEWFVLKLEINVNFQYIPQINHIIVNRDNGNIIMLGKELTFIRIDFVQQRIIDKTTRKNIQQAFTGHKGKVTGIVADPDHNRVITYSDDSSFMIWEETVDSFSGTNKARFVLQQYYPHCDLVLQQSCPNSILLFVLGRSDLIIVQYKYDNKVYTWNYQYDNVWLKRVFQLSDNTLPLVSVQFNKQKQRLTLTNKKQLIVFEVDTGVQFIVRTKPTNFYFGVYDYQAGYTSNYILYILQSSPTKFSFSVEYGIPSYPYSFVIQSNTGILRKCDYIEQTTSFCCITNLGLYVIENDFYIYNVNMPGLSAFSYEGGTRNIVAYTQDLKVTYLLRDYISYTPQRSFVFSATVDVSAISTTQVPSMYFFYQNTPVSSIGSQVIFLNYLSSFIFALLSVLIKISINNNLKVFAMNPNIDVQQLVSFKDTITCLFVNQNNQKIYVGFSNGLVQTGYFQTNYLQLKAVSNASPIIYYSKANRSIYYYYQVIN